LVLDCKKIIHDIANLKTGARDGLQKYFESSPDGFSDEGESGAT
jgi:hypothetical protein